MNGKGSRPRNVGPEFNKNFQEIDWKHDDDSVIDTQVVKRTSTKRIYLYGASADHTGGPFEFVPIPPFECLNPNCVNGGVDSGGVTPWGARITLQCPVCAGTCRI